jgi:hypothetical protein
MIHWETGKEIDALESNPEAMSRETCLSQYRNGKFMPRVTGSTKDRNFRLILQRAKCQFLFCTPSLNLDTGDFFAYKKYAVKCNEYHSDS